MALHGPTLSARTRQAMITPCAAFQSPEPTLVAVDEHLQNSLKDTRLCNLMVRTIAQRKGHVWDAQSVAVCQIIVA